MFYNTILADITDLQIEGISLHDSLLDVMSQKEIDQAKVTFYPKSKKFKMIQSNKISNLDYDMVFFSVKSNDSNYKIYEIKTIVPVYNLTDCFVQRNDLVKDIKQTFETEFSKGKVKIKRWEDINDDDKTGESLVDSVDFIFEDGKIRVACDYYGKEFRIKNNLSSDYNHLSISIFDNEFYEWIQKESQ